MLIPCNITSNVTSRQTIYNRKKFILLSGIPLSKCCTFGLFWQNVTLHFCYTVMLHGNTFWMIPDFSGLSGDSSHFCYHLQKWDVCILLNVLRKSAAFWPFSLMVFSNFIRFIAITSRSGAVCSCGFTVYCPNIAIQNQDMPITDFDIAIAGCRFACLPHAWPHYQMERCCHSFYYACYLMERYYTVSTYRYYSM